MTALHPMETFLEPDDAPDLPLPVELAAIYGRLAFAVSDHAPHVIGNMVTTLDGVVSLGTTGQSGGDISGFNRHDRALMGLLRAVADAIIIGAGSVRAVPDHIWTPEHVYPALAPAYKELRTLLGKVEPPLTVVVTSSGDLSADHRMLSSPEAPVLIVTTPRGAQQLGRRSLSSHVMIREVDTDGSLSADAVLEEALRARGGRTVLVEGGPHLLGDFLSGRRLDELFLTLAPQIAGRLDDGRRPGLVAGTVFAPENPRWGALVGLKRAGNHLFLRYAFS